MRSQHEAVRAVDQMADQIIASIPEQYADAVPAESPDDGGNAGVLAEAIFARQRGDGEARAEEVEDRARKLAARRLIGD